ncbi:MAG: hypothetical protein ACFFCP_02275 [Promethearchaeota archaeon]
MVGTHPQGMNQRNFDGKTGGDSVTFSKLCLGFFLIAILVMIVVVITRI